MSLQDFLDSAQGRQQPATNAPAPEIGSDLEPYNPGFRGLQQFVDRATSGGGEEGRRQFEVRSATRRALSGPDTRFGRQWNEEDPFASRVARRSIPVLSSVMGFLDQTHRGQLQRRVADGTASQDDYDLYIRDAKRQEMEAKHGLGDTAVDTLLHLPALAGEAMIPGGLLGRTAATGTSVATRLPMVQRAYAALTSSGFYIRTGVTTATMPSMYLERWAQNSAAAGRDPWNPAGLFWDLPRAFGLGMMNVAVLGSLGHIANDIPGKTLGAYLQRFGTRVPVGMLEQQAVDTIASFVRLDTGYGLAGDLIQGNWEAAGKHALSQAIMFGAFAAMHEKGGRDRIRDTFLEASREMSRDGLPAKEADQRLTRVGDTVQKMVDDGFSRGAAVKFMRENFSGPELRYAEVLAREIVPEVPEPRQQPAQGPQPGQEAMPEAQQPQAAQPQATQGQPAQTPPSGVSGASAASVVSGASGVQQAPRSPVARVLARIEQGAKPKDALGIEGISPNSNVGKAVMTEVRRRAAEANEAGRLAQEETARLEGEKFAPMTAGEVQLLRELGHKDDIILKMAEAQRPAGQSRPVDTSAEAPVRPPVAPEPVQRPATPAEAPIAAEATPGPLPAMPPPEAPKVAVPEQPSPSAPKPPAPKNTELRVLLDRMVEYRKVQEGISKELDKGKITRGEADALREQAGTPPTREEINRAGKLSEREAHVLWERIEGRTLEEIAYDKEVNKGQGKLSRERVRQIEADAIKKLEGHESIRKAIHDANEASAAVDMAEKGGTVNFADLHVDPNQVAKKARRRMDAMETETRALKELANELYKEYRRAKQRPERIAHLEAEAARIHRESNQGKQPQNVQAEEAHAGAQSARVPEARAGGEAERGRAAAPPEGAAVGRDAPTRAAEQGDSTAGRPERIDQPRGGIAEPLPPQGFRPAGGTFGEGPLIPTGSNKKLAMAHEVVAKHREREMNKPDVEKQGAQGDEAVWEAVREQVAANPRRPAELAKEIVEAQGKRGVTTVESGMILHRMVAVENQLQTLRKKAQAEGPAMTDRAYQMLGKEIQELVAERDLLHQASSFAGSEAGRLMRFRRMYVKFDYSMDSLLQRAEVAKKAPLTKEEVAQITELQTKIDTLQQKLEEANAARIKELEPASAAGDKEAAKKIETMKADPERLPSDEGFLVDQAKKEWTKIETKFKEDAEPAHVRWTRNVFDVLNIPRSLMTVIDFPLGRQGNFALLSHPLRTLKGVQGDVKATFSEEAAKRAEYELRHRKNYILGQQAGLELTERDGNLLVREEGFLSRLVNKIPGIGSVVRGSERGYVTQMNRIRAESFDAMANTLAAKDTMTMGGLKVLANYANVMTGRGNLYGAEKSAAWLSQVFFAPRWWASRLQMLAGQPLWHGIATPGIGLQLEARKLVARDYAQYAAGIGVIASLAIAAGFKLEKDPRSTDFGKIVVGNTRLDISGALSQSLVLASRLATGERATATGERSSIRGDAPMGSTDAAGLLGSYVRGKLAPGPGTAIDLLSGKDVVGKPVTPAGTAERLVTPLFLRDVQEAYQDLGLPRATIVSLIALAGFGVQTYQPGKRQEDLGPIRTLLGATPAQPPKRQVRTAPGIGRVR